MKNNNIKVYLIINIATFIVLSVGATFAFFSSSINQEHMSMANVSTNSASYTFISFANDYMNLNITNESMQIGKENTVADMDDAHIKASLVSDNDSVNIKCSYDLVFVWDSTDTYTKPDKALSSNEYEFSISEANTPLLEKDLSSFSWKDDGTSKYAILFSDSLSSALVSDKDYHFTLKMYNIDANQKIIRGMNYQGHIEIRNILCKTI